LSLTLAPIFFLNFFFVGFLVWLFFGPFLKKTRGGAKIGGKNVLFANFKKFSFFRGGLPGDFVKPFFFSKFSFFYFGKRAPFFWGGAPPGAMTREKLNQIFFPSHILKVILPGAGVHFFPLFVWGKKLLFTQRGGAFLAPKNFVGPRGLFHPPPTPFLVLFFAHFLNKKPFTLVWGGGQRGGGGPPPPPTSPPGAPPTFFRVFKGFFFGFLFVFF